MSPRCHSGQEPYIQCTFEETNYVLPSSLHIIRATAHTSWGWRDSTLKIDFHALIHRDQNNRFSNARQNVQYYQIFTRHFKNPLDIISACLGSQVQVPPTCLSAKMYYDNFWHASIFLL